MCNRDGLLAWRAGGGTINLLGYGRRSLGETAVGRYKPLIDPKLRARTLPGQQGEVALAVQALNRMIRTAKPASVRTA